MQLMNAVIYPQPFDQIRLPMPQGELIQVKDTFMHTVQDVLGLHEAKVHGPDPNDLIVQTKAIQLHGEVDSDEFVSIKIISIESFIFNSAIVGMHWLNGVRDGNTSTYHLDPNVDAVVRRDTGPVEGEMTKKRLDAIRKTLPKISSPANALAPHAQLAREEAANRELERALRLNNVPIRLGEMHWLRRILLVAYPVAAEGE